MLDILVFALPADRARAEEIVNAIHEEKTSGSHRLRFVTEDKMDDGWLETERLSSVCPCVIFCWSQATEGDDARFLRSLAERTLADDRALSVELEENSLPASMAASTCYPLYGWRAALSGWKRFLFGNAALKQIAIAASRKVSGQDPPPPQAFWRMVRAQAWITLLGIFALSGTLTTAFGFYHDHLAQIVNVKGAKEYRAFEAKPTCEGARKIAAEDGAWADDARKFVANCHVVQTIRWDPQDKDIPIYGATHAEAEVDARKKCAQYAQMVSGRDAIGKVHDFVAGGEATVRCHLVVPTPVDREVMQ